MKANVGVEADCCRSCTPEIADGSHAREFCEKVKIRHRIVSAVDVFENGSLDHYGDYSKVDRQDNQKAHSFLHPTRHI